MTILSETGGCTLHHSIHGHTATNVMENINPNAAKVKFIVYNVATDLSEGTNNITLFLQFITIIYFATELISSNFNLIMWRTRLVHLRQANNLNLTYFSYLISFLKFYYKILYLYI